MPERISAKSRTRLLSAMFFLLCLAFGVWMLFDWFLVGRTIRVSKATTFVEGPLDNEGNVDFGAALNQYMSQDVTPHNNAVVDLVRVLGPSALPSETANEFFERLGIEPVSPNGAYFVDLAEYAKSIDAPSFNESQVFAKIALQPWSPLEYPVARQWLEANAHVIKGYRAAASRTHIYHPIVRPKTGLILDSPLPLIEQSRNLTRLMMVDSLLQMEARDWKTAALDIQSIRDLGVLLTQRGGLPQWLIGYNFILRHFELQLALCRHVSAVDPDALPAIAAWFRDWNPPADLLTGPAAVKRMELLDAVAALAQRRPHLWNDEQINERLASLSRGGLYVIDANAALVNCNRWLDQQYVALFTADRIRRDEQLALFEAELNRQAKKYDSLESALISRLSRTGRAKLVTDVMMSLMMPAWRTIANAESRIFQLNDLTKLMFGLELFRSRNGKYPSQLTELTPDFIAAIPNDRFADQPLKYYPDDNGLILYSMGGNRLDNAGADYPNDVTLRLSRKD